MELHQILAVCVVVLFCGSFLAGYLGFTKGWKIDWSDKLDLFYVEPRNVKMPDRRPVLSTNCGRREQPARRSSQISQIPNQVSVIRRRKTQPTAINASVCRSLDRECRSIPRVEHTTETPVFGECVETLRALGFKLAEAKSEVTKFFQSHVPKDASEFIQAFYNKDKQ